MLHHPSQDKAKRLHAELCLCQQLLRPLENDVLVHETGSALLAVHLNGDWQACTL